MKILLADKFPEEYQKVLKDKGHSITFEPSLKEDTLPDAIKDHNVLVVRSTKVTPKTIDNGSDLKMIIRAGAGYNTIDINHAKSKGIPVCNCPGTNSIAVAELAMGLILSIDRRIYHNVRDLRGKKWSKKEYSKAEGIFGKSIGIIGLGHIGRYVAERAGAFGLKLLGYDPFLDDAGFKKINAKKYDDMHKMLEDADIVTIHLPENDKTRGLVDDKFFSHMKDGAIFINTSRGGIVKQASLIKAINEKNIRAGIDVYENEPDANANDFNDEITQIENVYGTHHIGASTNQAQLAVASMAVEIIEKFKSTGDAMNRVNP